MDIYEKIKRGDYEPKTTYLTYPTKPKLKPNATSADIRAYADAVEVYELSRVTHEITKQSRRAEESHLCEQFKADCIAEYWVGEPDAFADSLYALAWDEGHSGGYESVAGEFSELFTGLETTTLHSRKSATNCFP